MKTTRPCLYTDVPPPQVQVCVRWCWLNACVFWSYPNMRETTVHPLPSSESSASARRLVLIRSPSSLSSLHPHPTRSFFFSGTAGGAAAGRQGIKRPTSLHSNVPFNLHVAPPSPFTPRLNLSHLLPTVPRQHNVASSWTERYTLLNNILYTSYPNLSTEN